MGLCLTSGENTGMGPLVFIGWNHEDVCLTYSSTSKEYVGLKHAIVPTNLENCV